MNIVELGTKTLSELQDIARESEVTGYSRLKKHDLIMRLLFGQQFLGEAALLVPYSIAMLLLALVNVWMLYFLAVKEKLYTVFLLVGALSIILVLFTLQLSFSGVVRTLILCNGGLALAGALLLWRRSDSENGS